MQTAWGAQPALVGSENKIKNRKNTPLEELVQRSGKGLVGVNGEKAQTRGLREAVGPNPWTRACEICSTPVSSGLASVEPGEDKATFCKVFGQLT